MKRTHGPFTGCPPLKKFCFEESAHLEHLPSDICKLLGFDYGLKLEDYLTLDSLSKSFYEGCLTRSIYEKYANRVGVIKWSDCENDKNKNKWNCVLSTATKLFLKKFFASLKKEGETEVITNFQKIYHQYEGLINKFPLFGAFVSNELFSLSNRLECDIGLGKNYEKSNRLLEEMVPVFGGDFLLKALHSIKFYQADHVPFSNEDFNNELQYKVYTLGLEAIKKGDHMAPLEIYQMFEMYKKFHQAGLQPTYVFNKGLMRSLLSASSEKGDFTACNVIFDKDKEIFELMVQSGLDCPPVHLFQVRYNRNLPFKNKKELLEKVLVVYEINKKENALLKAYIYLELARCHEKVEGTDKDKIKQTNEFYLKAYKAFGMNLPQSTFQYLVINRTTKGLVLPDTQVRKIAFKNGDVYQGELQASLRHGDGVMHYPNGQSLSGTWGYDQLIDGKGLFISEKGTFIGDIKKGEFHGSGTLTHPDGYVSEGEWQEGTLINGKGRIKRPFDVLYEGEVLEGKFHGLGKLSIGPLNALSTHLEGRWSVGNLVRGEGKVVFKDGSICYGKFKDLKPITHFTKVYFSDVYEKYPERSLVEARRTVTTPNGTLTGFWKNGMCENGEGYRSYPNGNYYGQFKDSKPHGLGTFHDINGKTFSVEWKEGFINRLSIW